jgi:GMP synthase-like glutamine amidotransferase
LTKLLLLNHRGVSVVPLVELVRSFGADVDAVEPEAFSGPLPTSGYDGVIASGGYLKSSGRRETLRRYSAFFEESRSPYLGICLGMRILGHCHGARFRKTAPVVGEYQITLKGFPLCPELSDSTVYQNHRYEIIRPLPGSLEDFTVGGTSVQAIKVVGKEQYAVQFHPEVGSSPARVILRNFVSVCSGESQKFAQGT